MPINNILAAITLFPYVERSITGTVGLRMVVWNGSGVVLGLGNSRCNLVLELPSPTWPGHGRCLAHCEH
jgi:hypothetical protein